MKTLLTITFVAGITFRILSQTLNGSYTVGGTSPNFATLQEVASALKLNGISGPVTFNIRPGTYVRDNGATSVMILDSIIAGNTSSNRITFQPDVATGGNVNNVILQVNFNTNSTSNETQIIKVESDFTTFRNLTFKDADSLDVPARWLIRALGVSFWNATVEGLVVEGCRFIGTPYYNQAQQFGSDYGIYSDYLGTGTIRNNHFSNLMRAVGLDVETGGVNGDSVIAEDNKFDHLYLGFSGAGTPLGSAIQVEFPHTFIKRNFVSNSAGAQGIVVVYPVDGEIEANYVRGFYNAPMSTSLNSASQDRTDSLIIFNNVVIGSSQSGNLQVYTKNTKIYHNTIVHSGSNTIALHVYGNNCSVINNIFLAYGGWLLYEQLEAANLISDHNLFYSTCSNFARSHQGNYYPTLESYQLATGLDLNSHFSDVIFDFDSLGIHLDECQAQNDGLDGIPLAEVPFDFYGARRDSVKPFVGAVEGVRLPYDMFGEPFRTSLTGFPLSVTTGDFDHSNSIGIAVPDWDNSQVLLFHNNGESRTFTQSGTVSTDLQPTLIKLYDLDEDNNLDLIVSGNTNAVEIFWGDGNGSFPSSDIVQTFGTVRSLEPGPRFVDFSTIITTEDGFQPSTSLIGYIMNSAGRELCYDVQRSAGSNFNIDTIQSVLTDFVLADLGAGENMPAIVAPGLFGSSSLIPKLFAFDVFVISDFGAVCQQAAVDFLSSDQEYQFPVTGYYTNSSSIVSGDFDGDLDPDFITTGFDDNYCVFIKNNGSFNFSSDTIFTASTRGIAALDYENDGDLDFIAENNTLDSLGITIFLNDGVGNFEEKRNCFFPFASGHPNGIAAADFDQDGNTDIAIVSRSLGGFDSLFVLYNLEGYNQTTGVERQQWANVTPDKFELSQNYPNPFNPSTKIEYTLPVESKVKILVFNILGEKVRDLVNDQLAAGFHTINFNAGNLASGIYIYTIEAKTISGDGTFITAKKMILLR